MIRCCCADLPAGSLRALLDAKAEQDAAAAAGDGADGTTADEMADLTPRHGPDATADVDVGELVLGLVNHKLKTGLAVCPPWLCPPCSPAGNGASAVNTHPTRTLSLTHALSLAPARSLFLSLSPPLPLSLYLTRSLALSPLPQHPLHQPISCPVSAAAISSFLTCTSVSVVFE